LPSSAATNYFIDRQYFDIIMMASAAAAAATVVFVDVRFYEDKRGINDIRYRAKVASSTAHQLIDVVKKAAGSLVKHIIEGGGG
jgi:hypothetical protein